MITLKENDLVFAKVKPNAIIPTKEDENAGYDIYACFDEDYIMIPPHTTKLIPTGIAAAVPNKYYLQVHERGSTGSKGMKYGAGVIDSSYRGEIFICINNVNDKFIVISKLNQEDLLAKHSLHLPDVLMMNTGKFFYELDKTIWNEYFRLPTFLSIPTNNEPNPLNSVIVLPYDEHNISLERENLYLFEFDDADDIGDNYKDKLIVYPYSKAIAQLIIHKVPVMNQYEVTYDELKNIPSARGCGALGSSGK